MPRYTLRYDTSTLITSACMAMHTSVNASRDTDLLAPFAPTMHGRRLGPVTPAKVASRECGGRVRPMSPKQLDVRRRVEDAVMESDRLHIQTRVRGDGVAHGHRLQDHVHVVQARDEHPQAGADASDGPVAQTVSTRPPSAISAPSRRAVPA